MKAYIDLETGPADYELLAKLMPQFEPAANLKDPVKIESSIGAKRADWIASAALRSTTGKILAVTMAQDNAEPEFLTGDEATLIDKAVQELCDPAVTVYGWNLHGFDLPFLCQRAAVHGIKAFPCLTTKFKGRYSWCENLVDAMTVWNMSHQHVSGSGLGAVALALGVGEKSGDGKDFAELLKTDPDKAKEYAVNDVNLLRKIVERMGI